MTKLTLLDTRSVTLYGSAVVDRIEKRYRVSDDKGDSLGHIVLHWGTDQPGERTKVVSFWGIYPDPNGNMVAWRDYRKDAIAELVRLASK